MFRTVSNVVVAGVAAKCVYDAGYYAGKNNRHNFFSSFTNNTLKAIEEQLAEQDKAPFKRAVLHAQHEAHIAANRLRERFGFGPK